MKHITRRLVATFMIVMLLSTTALAAIGYFPDVPEGAAYADAVNALADMGILTGDENGKFNPNSTITRAEFATMMVRLLDEEDRAKTITKSSFTDVPSTHWACGYVTVAVELGLVNGYGDGRYGPSDTLTYEQAVKVLVCMLGYENDALSAGGWPNGYTQVANALQLTANTDNLQSANVSRSVVAVLCFNSLSIPPSEWEGIK